MVADRLCYISGLPNEPTIIEQLEHVKDYGDLEHCVIDEFPENFGRFITWLHMSQYDREAGKDITALVERANGEVSEVSYARLMFLDNFFVDTDELKEAAFKLADRFEIESLKDLDM